MNEPVTTTHHEETQTEPITVIDGDKLKTIDPPAPERIYRWKAQEDPMPTHMIRVMEPHTDTVMACGHRLDIRMSEPRMRNCQHCWFAWFAGRLSDVAVAQVAVKQHGLDAVKQHFGKKGGKFFLEFTHQMEEYQKAQEEKELEAAKQEVAEHIANG